MFFNVLTESVKIPYEYSVKSGFFLKYLSTDVPPVLGIWINKSLKVLNSEIHTLFFKVFLDLKFTKNMNLINQVKYSTYLTI
jgi:hypothetical protein